MTFLFIILMLKMSKSTPWDLQGISEFLVWLWALLSSHSGQSFPAPGDPCASASRGFSRSSVDVVVIHGHSPWTGPSQPLTAGISSNSLLCLGCAWHCFASA